MVFINFIEYETGKEVGFSMGSMDNSPNEGDKVIDKDNEEWIVVKVEQDGVNNIVYFQAWVIAA